VAILLSHFSITHLLQTAAPISAYMTGVKLKNDVPSIMSSDTVAIDLTRLVVRLNTNTKRRRTVGIWDFFGLRGIAAPGA
jgi:hypothetical protein